MNDSNEKKPGLKIHIDPAIATGHYVNFSVVNHSQTEFVLDSAYIQPQAPVAHVRSRLIMNPLYAKRFMQTLQKILSATRLDLAKSRSEIPKIPLLFSNLEAYERSSPGKTSAKSSKS